MVNDKKRALYEELKRLQNYPKIYRMTIYAHLMPILKEILKRAESGERTHDRHRVLDRLAISHAVGSVFSNLSSVAFICAAGFWLTRNTGNAKKAALVCASSFSITFVARLAAVHYSIENGVNDVANAIIANLVEVGKHSVECPMDPAYLQEFKEYIIQNDRAFLDRIINAYENGLFTPKQLKYEEEVDQSEEIHPLYVSPQNDYISHTERVTRARLNKKDKKEHEGTVACGSGMI